MKDFLAKLNAFLAFAWPYVVMLAEWLIAKAKAAFSAFLGWLGPVADSVKGKLNSDEVRRALIKGGTSGGAFSLWNMFNNPDVIDVLLIPAGIVFFVAVLDGARRRNHGDCSDPDCPHA
ncbi:hypothetical protein [Singulisphaera sp. PoT]|uniref:hypothetical protein n=1 Tax=Singulisphaera sp. PoT TaxID=3411797 RepID=UPI003BF54BA5